MTGVYGKLPAHGDFVRRELPLSFVQPWDAWLQAGLAGVRERVGKDFGALWAAAPAWRFRLPAGACGDMAVAGVLLPSQDTVGRRFPLTLAALTPEGAPLPDDEWYAALEHHGSAARDQGDGVDLLLAALPEVFSDPGRASADAAAACGWWMHNGPLWQLDMLPTLEQFEALLRGGRREPEWLSRCSSHAGTVRALNEDSYLDRADIGLWAVADGAGGHGGGDVASAAVIAALQDLPSGYSAGELLAQVRLRLNAVHLELHRMAEDRADQGMFVTTVVVLIVRGDHFACLWAGDSRAYLLRDGELCPITRDHSVVQEMVDAGLLAPEDAEGHSESNIITRAVGAPDELELSKVSSRLYPRDVILLCSDGLYKALSESEIAETLAAGQGPDELIQRALRANARDNVTAVTVEMPA